jgi:hypothetical protein
LLAQELIGTASVNDCQLSLVYFPTAYGTVLSPSSPPSGETELLDQIEDNLGSSANASVAVDLLPAETSGLPSDQAQVNAELTERIQKLEELLRQNQSGTEPK